MVIACAGPFRLALCLRCPSTLCEVLGECVMECVQESGMCDTCTLPVLFWFMSVAPVQHSRVIPFHWPTVSVVQTDTVQER